MTDAAGIHLTSLGGTQAPFPVLLSLSTCHKSYGISEQPVNVGPDWNIARESPF